MKKVLLMGVLAVISVGVINVNASAATTKKSVKVASSESEKKAAVAQAEKFINGYLKSQDYSSDKWMEKAGTTKKFREEYKKYAQYIEISSKILETQDSKELAKLKQAQKYLENYSGTEYDPIFSAAIMNVGEKPVFKVISYNEKTRIAVLTNTNVLSTDPKVIVDGKSEDLNVEIPVKVVKQNGKWLVDGAGNVNLK